MYLEPDELHADVKFHDNSNSSSLFENPFSVVYEFYLDVSIYCWWNSKSPLTFGQQLLMYVYLFTRLTTKARSAAMLSVRAVIDTKTNYVLVTSKGIYPRVKYLRKRTCMSDRPRGNLVPTRTMPEFYKPIMVTAGVKGTI